MIKTNGTSMFKVGTESAVTGKINKELTDKHTEKYRSVFSALKKIFRQTFTVDQM